MNETLTDAPESLLAHVIKDRRRYWTPAELAELLRVTPAHIYALLDSGDLSAHEFSRRKRGFRPDRQHSVSDLFASQPRRACTRITRLSVIKYLIDTAEFDLSAEDLTLSLAAIAEDLPTPALIALEKHFISVRQQRAAC